MGNIGTKIRIKFSRSKVKYEIPYTGLDHETGILGLEEMTDDDLMYLFKVKQIVLKGVKKKDNNIV